MCDRARAWIIWCASIYLVLPWRWTCVVIVCVVWDKSSTCTYLFLFLHPQLYAHSIQKADRACTALFYTPKPIPGEGIAHAMFEDGFGVDLKVKYKQATPKHCLEGSRREERVVWLNGLFSFIDHICCIFPASSTRGLKTPQLPPAIPPFWMDRWTHHQSTKYHKNYTRLCTKHMLFLFHCPTHCRKKQISKREVVVTQ